MFLFSMPDPKHRNIRPARIGFLGICGTKYPVKRGVNKIGRDPTTCSIVLNLNSISRQHAVINILNDKEFLLMDLDSSNKTKLMDQSLQPYAPKPLRNGDTVQFGDVFGIFRLLEDDTDLPMTQAICAPDTPAGARLPCPRTGAAHTTIPESPDVSDRDDSFIIPSQPKGYRHQFKSPSNKYIKHSIKTISIQPIGSNKIENVYWSSSKKSTSLTLDDSNDNLYDSAISIKSDDNCNQNDDIHEMETQAPFPANKESTDSIYTAATQMPSEIKECAAIHSLDTQLPVPTEHLPGVCKINDQKEMQIDLFTANKENDNSIFNAETQLFEKVTNKISDNNNVFDADTQFPTAEKHDDVFANDQCHDSSIFNAETQPPNIQKEESIDANSQNHDNCVVHIKTQPSVVPKSIENKSIFKDASNAKLNVSDEEILFDEVNSQYFEDAFDSQPILPPETSPAQNTATSLVQIKIDQDVEIQPSPLKRKIRIKSDSSTDCEVIEDIDILPSQKSPMNNLNEEDVTDCEDDLFEDETENNKKQNKAVSPKVIFEDMLTQKIIEDASVTETNREKIDLVTDNPKIEFEDMQTQVIKDDECAVLKNDSIVTSVKDPTFEDMPTQVLQEDNIRNEANFEDLLTQVVDEVISNVAKEDIQQYSEGIMSPFKVPLHTPLKNKRRDISKASDPKPVKLGASETKIPMNNKSDDDDDKYYAATQDLFDDLCSQRESSPEVVHITPIKPPNPKPEQNKLSKRVCEVAEKSSGSSDGEERVNSFVTSLSRCQIRDLVGVDAPVDALKKQSSDPSDVENTPKKIRTFNLLQTDLPNSQEIKCSVSRTSKSLVTESSSESEVEEDSQDGTPILYRRKKRPKVEPKMNLTKKFDSKALPTRIITRVRKPTYKMQEGDEESKKASKSILKPAFLTEQDSDVDKEIITENITRLKSNNDKKNNKSPKSDNLITNDVKNENKTSPKTNIIETPEPTKKPEVKKETKIRQNKKDKEPESKDSYYYNRSRRTRKNEKDSEAESNNKTPKSQTAEAILSTSNITESLNTTTKTNTRSTRSLSYQRTNENKNVKDSVSPEKGTATKKRGRPKRGQKKKVESSPEEVSIRRSKRQKAINTSAEHKTKTHVEDLSTVYSISSESDANSPKRLKRPALDAVEAPGAKRTRAGADSVAVLRNSRRATPARTVETQHVLFTAFPYEEVKVKLEELGAVIVSEVSSCTVVVTLQIKRTFKLLCAVGMGRPVVGPAWVQACVDSGAVVDPWLYLLKDTATEARFLFSLQRTLAGRRNFLKGYNVSCTPSVMPGPAEMKLIVECSGGAWRAGGPRWLCVSCSADRAQWQALAQRGAQLVTTELVLSGVLRQTLDIEGNRLKI